MSNKLGKLLIFSAPSGSGKTTLVKHLLNEFNELAFSVSATSRSKRSGEKHGKDYYFMSAEIFRKKIESGLFLEWEEVYDGIFYGTLFEEVERLRKKGKNVVFDVDVVGGISIKKHYGDQALSVFVKAPSLEVLAERLRRRKTDSEESITKRLQKAEWETNFEGQFDIILINDNLNEAHEKISKIVTEFIGK
jgi:guanylate kinase